MTPGDLLREAADLFDKRNDEYKDNYKRVGDMYTLLFPNGVQLKDDIDFNRFAIFIQIINKTVRYSFNFSKPTTQINPDHLNDLATYAMMLQELDNIERGYK